MGLYVGGYRAFKKCLVDAWPNGKAANCAHMVMIDIGFPIHLIDGVWCVRRDIHEFTASINMIEPLPSANVSTYLATHYPKTSSALFNGASKADALKIILKEKACKKLQSGRGSFKEAKHEAKKAASYRTIKMRSLSKKHDWNTVK